MSFLSFETQEIAQWKILGVPQGLYTTVSGATWSQFEDPELQSKSLFHAMSYFWFSITKSLHVHCLHEHSQGGIGIRESSIQC